MENCQLGVFLAYAAPDGSRALIDRQLYLPESWTSDRDRCREAGIGDDVAFATKPELARAMVQRAMAAGAPFSWFTADEAYGQNPGLRDWLEEQRISYVVAVPCSQRCATAAGQLRADELAARVPGRGRQVLSCGDGSKGPRLYEWALIGLAGPGRRLLVRRALAGRERPAGVGVLPAHGPGRDHAGRADRGRRRQVGSRGLLRRGQERDRPGPLPGPPLLLRAVTLSSVMTDRAPDRRLVPSGEGAAAAYVSQAVRHRSQVTKSPRLQSGGTGQAFKLIQVGGGGRVAGDPARAEGDHMLNQIATGAACC